MIYKRNRARFKEIRERLARIQAVRNRREVQGKEPGKKSGKEFLPNPVRHLRPIIDEVIEELNAKLMAENQRNAGSLVEEDD